MSEIATARLLLRQWRDSDLAPFAALNADPEVMQYMPRCLERSESEALVGRYRERIAERGWDLWALERRDDGGFVGALGLAVATFPAPFTPCVEIAWRLPGHSGARGWRPRRQARCCALASRPSLLRKCSRSPCPRTAARGR